MIMKFKITVNDYAKVLNFVSRGYVCSLNVIFTVPMWFAKMQYIAFRSVKL